jgi:hypothetical protein
VAKSVRSGYGPLFSQFRMLLRHELSPSLCLKMQHNILLFVPLFLLPSTKFSFRLNATLDGLFLLPTSFIFFLHLVVTANTIQHQAGGKVDSTKNIRQDHGWLVCWFVRWLNERVNASSFCKIESKTTKYLPLPASPPLVLVNFLDVDETALLS